MVLRSPMVLRNLDQEHRAGLHHGHQVELLHALQAELHHVPQVELHQGHQVDLHQKNHLDLVLFNLKNLAPTNPHLNKKKKDQLQSNFLKSKLNLKKT